MLKSQLVECRVTYSLTVRYVAFFLLNLPTSCAFKFSTWALFSGLQIRPWVGQFACMVDWNHPDTSFICRFIHKSANFWRLLYFFFRDSMWRSYHIKCHRSFTPSIYQLPFLSAFTYLVIIEIGEKVLGFSHPDLMLNN